MSPLTRERSVGERFLDRFMRNVVAILGLVSLLYLLPPQNSAQGFPSGFSGYYALAPQNGDHFGNWTRTGNISVDPSPIPYGLRLELNGPSSGSFTVAIPAPVQLNMLFETTILGDGAITFWARGPGLPYEVHHGLYVVSTGSVLNQGDTYGFFFRAGENSRVAINVLEFHVIPEPSAALLIVLGRALLISGKTVRASWMPLNPAKITSDRGMAANKVTSPNAGIALRFQLEHPRPGVGEFHRSVR